MAPAGGPWLREETGGSWQKRDPASIRAKCVSPSGPLERRRTGEQGSFKTLSKAAQDIGYTHPRPGILNSLCNLLKHDNVDHAEALASQWSEPFIELPHGDPGQREWKLAIQDHHVEQVFDIVARAGPQKNS